MFKMWYYGTDGDQWAGGKSHLCYAISHDGLTWDKPTLGLVEFHGSNDNNIVHEDFRLAYVFIDPHGKAEERFKMIHWTGPGIRVETSPDGLHWDHPSHEVSTLAPDTQKMAWWEPRLNKYVAYFRVGIEEDNISPFPFVEPIESDPPVVAPKTMRPGRAVGRVEVDDILAPWPEEDMRTVFTADEHDPLDSDIYTHGLYRYPYAADAYFMFPMIYQHFREGESTVRNDGLNDTQLCASRDGIHWMRYDRKPYIPRGLPGEPDAGMTGASEFHIRKGDYLYQYYGGWPWTHGGYRRFERPGASGQGQLGPGPPRSGHTAAGRVCLRRRSLHRWVAGHPAHGIQGRPPGAEHRRGRHGRGHGGNPGRAGPPGSRIHPGRLRQGAVQRRGVHSEVEGQFGRVRSGGQACAPEDSHALSQTLRLPVCLMPHRTRSGYH